MSIQLYTTDQVKAKLKKCYLLSQTSKDLAFQSDEHLTEEQLNELSQLFGEMLRSTYNMISTEFLGEGIFNE